MNKAKKKYRLAFILMLIAMLMQVLPLSIITPEYYTIHSDGGMTINKPVVRVSYFNEILTRYDFTVPLIAAIVTIIATLVVASMFFLKIYNRSTLFYSIFAIISMILILLSIVSSIMALKDVGHLSVELSQTIIFSCFVGSLLLYLILYRQEHMQPKQQPLKNDDDQKIEEGN